MYLEKIRIENFRTFRHAEIELLHPDRSQAELRKKWPMPEVLYPNINILLGSNGAGKSAFLKAVALACLGPTVRDSGIFSYRLVRREPGVADVPREVFRNLSLPGKPITMKSSTALIRADFMPNAQDKVPADTKVLTSRVRIDRKGDLETLQFLDRVKNAWDPIFQDSVDAFFFVGYGASRRTEQRENVDHGGRRKVRSMRASRVQGMFEEDVTLMPLSAWLPRFKTQNPGRHSQVVTLLKEMTTGAYFRFTGEMEAGEYLFEREGMLVPYPAMSDGYRAFFGWVGDLLYHVCMTSPSGKKLVENQGIVLIDEIDLHLHPIWQMEILPRLSKALPKVQFIATTHSPLIVGSVQWINLITLQPGPNQSSLLERKEVPVHGLDSDQVLVSPYFGLTGTRTSSKAVRLRELRDRARAGDEKAVMLMMQELRAGSEAIQDPETYVAPNTNTLGRSANKQVTTVVKPIQQAVGPRGSGPSLVVKKSGAKPVAKKVLGKLTSSAKLKSAKKVAKHSARKGAAKRKSK